MHHTPPLLADDLILVVHNIEELLVFVSHAWQCGGAVLSLRRKNA
jgi:hypothetical protein